VSYTIPYSQVIVQTKALLSDTYGADLNQNVAFGGTPDGVHDGTDSVLWTGSALTGTWDFASTTQAQAGTKSIEAINTVDNDEAQLERSSAITADDYVALSGFVYITSWSGTGTKEVELRTRLAGVDVGNSVNLSAYVDTGSTGAWQSFAIPISDLGLGTDSIDQIIIKTVDIGGGAAPNYYLDEIQWEETGAETWCVEPDLSSTFSISEMKITLADAFDSTLASSSVPKIPYNTFLTQAKLANGINIRLTTDEIVRFSGSFRQHIDFMAFPGLRVDSGGDGTNTWVSYTVAFDPPFIMDARTKDKLEVTISEDLSTLLFLRIFVRGGKEELEPGET
jgi:hypothetical protein